MALVESVVELLLQKLADPLTREAIFLHGIGDQVELIALEFEQMVAFLEDADAKQEGDRRVKRWVQHVRDVAYDAEDVIDTFVFKVANLRRTGFVGCIKRYACIFNELITRHEVGSKIKRLKIKINAIFVSKSTYGIENIGQGAGTNSAGLSHQEWRLTSPNVPETDFVGFEMELEMLVAQLTKGERRRCIVSVVGMGGLGKTTLTRKVYNTRSVTRRFDTQAWISISEQPSVKELLQTITKRCMVQSKDALKSVEKMDVVELRDKISRYLNDKRYLVVLDDIWKRESWDALKDAFPDVNNGSRVMLTTRIKDVALYADPRSQPHELRFLTNEESWHLLCKKALIRDGDCSKGLKKPEIEIVEKCHGLPLAIAVVGGLLVGKETWEWVNVSKSISRQLGQIEVQISRILSLSYKDLPYYLKPCFLYLANFPEDHEFEAKELIRLWAAEGFLKERGELTLEEVGEDYLMQLHQRSMVQLTRRNSSRGIKSCRIHDLLRDLSILEAKESKFLEVRVDNGNAPPASTARRLAIHVNDQGILKIKQPSTRHLRSMLIYAQGPTWLQNEQRRFLFQGFKLLRVLYLHGVKISELPKQIGVLILLRYLRCTNSSLKTLPSSIGNLINLQTLNLDSRGTIITPETIGKMHQLRHLQLGKKIRLPTSGPITYWGVIGGHPRLDLISNLQTLSGVHAGKWMEGCLENLTNLRNLEIVFETGANVELFYGAIVKLDCLHHLRVLTLDIYLFLSLPNLSCLLKLSKFYLGGKLVKLPEFPTNLTKLTLEYSWLKEDPLATLEKLKNLRILRLLRRSYVGEEMACSAQGFPQLESLHLVGLFLLEWKVNEGAMPNLLHLQIYDCLQLKKLPEGLQHVTTLKKLELWRMPDEFNARVKEDRGEDCYQIRHIPSIDIR